MTELSFEGHGFPLFRGLVRDGGFYGNGGVV